jgi:hypothetical protein
MLAKSSMSSHSSSINIAFLSSFLSPVDRSGISTTLSTADLSEFYATLALDDTANSQMPRILQVPKGHMTYEMGTSFPSVFSRTLKMSTTSGKRVHELMEIP